MQKKLETVSRRFRIWDHFHKEFVNPEIFLMINLSGKVVPTCTGNYTIQQSTGILDVNGKEIYEGDVVSCYHWFDGTQEKPETKENIVVKLKYKTNISYEIQGGFDGSYNFEDIEVVGNIFENKELLK